MFEVHRARNSIFGQVGQSIDGALDGVDTCGHLVDAHLQFSYVMLVHPVSANLILDLLQLFRIDHNLGYHIRFVFDRRR